MEQDNADGSDLELLRRSAAGDGPAFHRLVDRHEDRLFRLAVSLVGNPADAEDVLQETLVGAFRGLGRFQGRASVRTWITGILVTQAAKWWRDKKRHPMQPIDAASPPPVEGGGAGVEKRIDLQAALRQLSLDHREVLVLREFEQMSYEEIASALGVPRGTVESRLSRARAELKQKLQAYQS